MSWTKAVKYFFNKYIDTTVDFKYVDGYKNIIFIP